MKTLNFTHLKCVTNSLEGVDHKAIKKMVDRLEKNLPIFINKGIDDEFEVHFADDFIAAEVYSKLGLRTKVRNPFKKAPFDSFHFLKLNKCIRWTKYTLWLRQRRAEAKDNREIIK